jgi:hypothetical protein
MVKYEITNESHRLSGVWFFLLGKDMNHIHKTRILFLYNLQRGQQHVCPHSNRDPTEEREPELYIIIYNINYATDHSGSTCLPPQQSRPIGGTRT